MDRRSALLTAAAFTAAFPLRAGAATALRFATSSSDSGALVYEADAQGYLKQANLVTDIQYLSNGSASIAALLGGEIDVTGRNLNGKTVAVNALGGSPHVAVEAWIDKNGGDSTTVKYIEMTFSAMGPALASKRIDAGILNEPALSDALLNGSRLLGDAYGAIAPYWLTDCLVATESYIAAHSDDVRRFSAALHTAAIWANRNRDKTADMVAKLLKIDNAVVQKMHRAVFAEQLTPQMIQPVIDAGLHYGAIAKTM